MSMGKNLQTLLSQELNGQRRMRDREVVSSRYLSLTRCLWCGHM